MTQFINNALLTTISNAQPLAHTNISTTILAAEALHVSDQISSSTREAPKKKVDLYQDEIDRRALERSENEGMIVYQNIFDERTT